MEGLRPTTPRCCPGGAEGPPIARSAREHEARMARNMMSNHTDMQDKYCGHYYDIHPIQSQYKGNHKSGGAAKGRATFCVVAAEGRHLYILDIMFLAIRASCFLTVRAMRACAQGGSGGPCSAGGGSGGAFGPPREAGGFGGRHPPTPK